jgi:hypothetical protein
MNDRLGSRWRWRIVMWVATVLLVVAWWKLASWKSRTLVKGSSCPAILRVLHRDGSYTVQAWDWKMEELWTVASFSRPSSAHETEESMRAVLNSKGVAWRAGTALHVVDIAAPHRHREYRVIDPQPTWELLELSPDKRFAIFQNLPSRIYGPRLNALVVVDLQTGETKSKREWRSKMTVDPTSGEFKSFRMQDDPAAADEPAAAIWRFTEDGEWEMGELTITAPSVKQQKVFAQLDSQGKWHILDQEPPVRWAGLEQLTVIHTFGDGQRFVAVNMVGRTFVGDWKAKGLIDCDWLLRTAIAREYVEDGTALIVTDARDDAHVYDLNTGSELASETSASKRRETLFVPAGMFVVFALAWTLLAFREETIFWGLHDAVLATVLVQVAVLPVVGALEHGYTRIVPSYWVIDRAMWYLNGGLTGAAIATGWFWAHGRGFVAARWLAGTLWLISIVMVMMVCWGSGEFQLKYTLLAREWIIAALVIAAATAAITITIRPTLWTISNKVDETTNWRFGLGLLLLVFAFFGMGIFLVQSVFQSPQWTQHPVIAHATAGPFLLGALLVGLLFLRLRSLVVLGGLFLIGATAFGIYLGIFIVKPNPAPPFMPLFPITIRLEGEIAATINALVTILIPCLVLRWHGWHWTRSKRSTDNLAVAGS